MKKYLLSALFSVALLLPWVSQAQCDKLSEYTTPASASASSAAFTSISTTGTPWTLTDAVAGVFKFTMPFDMPIGTQVVHTGDTVYVSKNGYLSFGAQQATFPAPMSIAPMAYIDGDGYDAAQLAIYYKYDTTEGGIVTVEWHNAVVDTLEFNFQVKLCKQYYAIKFCFGNMTVATTGYDLWQGVMVSSNEVIGCTDDIAWPMYTRDDTTIAPRTLTTANTLPTNKVYTFWLPYRRPCPMPATDITATGAKLHWSAVIQDSTKVNYKVFYTTDTTLVHQFDSLLNEHEAQPSNQTIKTDIRTLLNGSGFTKVNSVLVDSTTLTGLQANTTYYYTVWTYWATSATLHGYPSEKVSFTTNMDTIKADTIDACVQYKIKDSVRLADGSYDTNVLITATDSTLRVVCRNGKDSILRQVYIIHEPQFRTTQAIICDSAFWYIWYDNTTGDTVLRDSIVMGADTVLRYSASVQQAYIVPDTTPMLGCDVRMLDLTVSRSATATLTAVACNTYTWKIGTDSTFATVESPTLNAYTHTDLTLNSDSLYRDTNIIHGHTVDGCDSIYTFELRLYGNGASTDTVIACDSARWINDTVYTASTTAPTFQLMGSNGCIHTVSLNLTINKSSDSTLAPVSACDTFLWKLDTVRWEVSPIKTRNITVGTYRTTGNYKYTFHNAAGCDSTVILPLTINYRSFAADTVTACDSYRWTTVDNRLYTKDTVIDINDTTPRTVALSKLRGNAHYTNAAGCDSVVALHLTIKKSSDIDTIEVTTCGTYTWDVRGIWQGSAVHDSVTYTLANNAAPANYTRTVKIDNAVGCDSTIKLILHLRAHVAVDSVDTVIATCASEYIYDGKRYAAPTGDNAAGKGTVEVVTIFVDTAMTGCDSLHNVVIIVGNPLYRSVNKTSCGEYTWNTRVGDGKTYAQLDENAPASALYRNITDNDYVYVNTVPTNTVEDTGHNYRYSTTGTTLKSHYKFAPDTVYSLNLNFQTAIFGYDTVAHLMTTRTLALGDSTILMDPYRTLGHDTTIDKSVRYGARTLYCDSIVRYNVNLVYNYTDVNTTICMSQVGDTVTWDAGGDDTAHVFVVPANPNTMKDTNYVAQVVVRDSATANEWGYKLFIHQLRNAYSTQTVVACGTYTWPENGATYTYSASATYPMNPADFVTYTGDNTCDSIVVLALTLRKDSVTSVQLCQNSYTWGITGRTYDADFSDTNIYHIVVDSIVIDTVTGACLSQNSLDLTLVKTDTTYERICNPATIYTWDANNRKYKYDATSGKYQYQNSGASTWTNINNATPYTHKTSVAGKCESAQYLDLRISNGQPTYGTIPVNVCEGSTGYGYVWEITVPTGKYPNIVDSVVTHGTYDNDTVVGYMFNNPRTGCDSILTLALTISNAGMGTDTIIACDGITWIDGNNYTESDSTARYRYPSTSGNGCDSIVTLYLTMYYSETRDISDTICAGNNYNANTFYIPANELPSQGIYRDSKVTGSTINGCDSVTILTLRVNPVSTSVENVKACQNYTWNGITYTTDGTYTQYGQNVYGCDSTATIVLAIGQPSSSSQEFEACEQITYQGVTYTNTTILVNNTINEYGCENRDTIRLIVNQPSHSEQWVTEYGSFYWFNGTTYTTSGTYSATLPGADIHGCDSIITLYLTIVNGIEEAGDADILSLYPNPTYGKVTISAENVLRVEVLDIVGRRVATYENTNVLDLTNLAEGAYTLRITLPDGIAVRKVVKK